MCTVCTPELVTQHDLLHNRIHTCCICLASDASSEGIACSLVKATPIRRGTIRGTHGCLLQDPTRGGGWGSMLCLGAE